MSSTLPVLGELFAATRGGGATLGGQPIRCSDRADLALALVGTGFAYAAARRREQARRLTEVIGAVRDIRRLGSAALDLCYVAAGRYDAYFETGLNSWDARRRRADRPRGRVPQRRLHRGGPSQPGELLVATPAIFAELQARLAAATR